MYDTYAPLRYTNTWLLFGFLLRFRLKSQIRKVKKWLPGVNYNIPRKENQFRKVWYWVVNVPHILRHNYPLFHVNVQIINRLANCSGAVDRISAMMANAGIDASTCLLTSKQRLTQLNNSSYLVVIRRRFCPRNYISLQLCLFRGLFVCVCQLKVTCDSLSGEGKLKISCEDPEL